MEGSSGAGDAALAAAGGATAGPDQLAAPGLPPGGDVGGPRLPGAAKVQQKDREREAGAATGGEAKAAKERLSRLLNFGRLKR